MNAADAIRRVGIKPAALAQDGLTFATNDYDVDRYQQVRRLAARADVDPQRTARR